MAKPKPEKKTKAATVIPHRLKGFIERIERLIEERDAIAGDIKDVFAEAKGVGYDIKTMRKVIQLRAMDAADRAEMETLLDVYLNALGMADRIVSAVQAGATYREAADAEGTSATKVHRLVTKTRGKNEPHESEQADPSTGEVIESPTAGVEPPVPGAAEQAPSIKANEAGSSAANPIDESCGRAEGSPVLYPATLASDQRSGADAHQPTRAHHPMATGEGGIQSAPHDTYQQSCGGVDGHASVVTQPRAPGLDGRAAPAVATGEGAGIQSGPHDTRTWDEIVPQIDPRLDRRRATA